MSHSVPALPANCSLRLVNGAIHPPRLNHTDTAGAVVEFHGVVRAIEGTRQIAAIEYECFEAMTRAQFARIFGQAMDKWAVETIELHHGIGKINAGEASLYLRVSSGHRGEAFAACQWIIDEMKRSVPIWKKIIF